MGIAVTALLGTTLVKMPPFNKCTVSLPVQDHQYWFRATEIFVQPWRGEHHVYGLFTVPVRYGNDRLYTARLMIRGLIENLPETSSAAGIINSDRDETKHSVMRVHLPTRMALWFLITGRFGDLNLPCNWWLVIADR